MTENIIIEESAETTETPSKVEKFKKFMKTSKGKLIAAGTTVVLVGGTVAAVLLLGKDNTDFEDDSPLELESNDSETEIA